MNKTIKYLIIGFCFGVISMATLIVVIGFNLEREPKFQIGTYDFGNGDKFKIMHEVSDPTQFKVIEKIE